MDLSHCAYKNRLLCILRGWVISLGKQTIGEFLTLHLPHKVVLFLRSTYVMVQGLFLAQVVYIVT